jgi:hypothetical protein
VRGEQDGFIARASRTHLRRLRGLDSGTIEFRLEVLYHIPHFSHLICRRVCCLPVSSADLRLGEKGSTVRMKGKI